MSTEPRGLIESMIGPPPSQDIPFQFVPTDTNGSRDALIDVFLRFHPEAETLKPHLRMLLDLGMRAERHINAKKSWTLLQDHGADSLARKTFDLIMKGHK